MGPIAGYVADRLDRRVDADLGRLPARRAVPDDPDRRQALVDLRGDRAGRGDQPGVGARQGRDGAQPGAAAPARGGQPDQPGHDLRLGAAGGRDLRRADAASTSSTGTCSTASSAARSTSRCTSTRVSFVVSGFVIARLKHIPSRPRRRATREQRADGRRRRLEVRRHHARRTRPGDRDRRCVRRRRRGDRAGPHLRLGPRRRRLRLRRAVRHRLRRPGARHVARPAAAPGAVPAAAVRDVRSRWPGCCCSRSRWSSSSPVVVGLTVVLGFFAGRRLDHRQHDARARGARRGARAHVRVRRLDDPAGARAGAGRRAAAGRAHRHPRHRPARRQRRPASSSTTAPPSRS